MKCTSLVFSLFLIVNLSSCRSFLQVVSRSLSEPNRAHEPVNLRAKADEKTYSIEEVELFAFKSGIYLKPTITGPALKLEAFVKDDLDYKIGYLTAFVRPFPFGLLQLETIQVLNRRQTKNFKREGWSMKGPGICFIMGSWALKWAYERGCRRAELLAVNDSDKMHNILISLYQSFGFRVEKYIDENNVGDRIIWGAIGTLMSLNIDEFMQLWTPKLRNFSSDSGNDPVL